MTEDPATGPTGDGSEQLAPSKADWAAGVESVDDRDGTPDAPDELATGTLPLHAQAANGQSPGHEPTVLAGPLAGSQEPPTQVVRVPAAQPGDSRSPGAPADGAQSPLPPGQPFQGTQAFPPRQPGQPQAPLFGQSPYGPAQSQQAFPPQQQAQPQPGFPQQGFPQQELPQPGFPQPGFGQPGFGQPGFGQQAPAFGQPPLPPPPPQPGFPQPAGHGPAQQPQPFQPQQPALPQQGFPQQGFPQQGFPQQGFSQQGFPQQGLHHQPVLPQSVSSAPLLGPGFPHPGYAPPSMVAPPLAGPQPALSRLPLAGPAGMLAGAADRERAIDVLKAAYGEGRLTKEEFDQRVHQVTQARTYGDLAAIIPDLPSGPLGGVAAYPAGVPVPAPFYPPAPQPTNGLAIGSLVCALLGMSLPAVIMGHVARRQIRERNQGGDGLAIAGLVVGWLGMAFYALIFIAAIAAAGGSGGS